MALGRPAPIERLTLDTSAYSALRRGRTDVLDVLASATLVGIPATVLGELEAGFELGTRANENRLALGELLAEPWVLLLPTTPAVARRYGEIFALLRRAGTPIPINDVWIAATTLEWNAQLLSTDDHFRRVAALSTIVLPA